MKKLLLASLVLVLLLAVSCSTTKASDVDPVVREVKISDYTSKAYSTDEVYRILERFAKDMYEGESLAYDKAAKKITIPGIEFESLVGALAQDGVIVTDIVLEAKEDKALVSLIFVDSYYVMYLGPIEKKVSQGITEYGLKALDLQANYLADAFESSISQYAYYIDNGTI